MAAAPEKCVPIVVVDGVLGALHRLRFPLPALPSMQDAGVHPSDASWNVRKTAFGLSMSLFWPCVSTNGSTVAPRISKSRKRRLRRRKHNSKPSVVDTQSQEPVRTHDFEINRSELPSQSPTQPRSDEWDDELQASQHDPQPGVLNLCLQVPVSVLYESELSPSDFARPVPPIVYHYTETSDRPGVCVVCDDVGKLCWSPIKVSKTAVKVGQVASSDDSDLDSDH